MTILREGQLQAEKFTPQGRNSEDYITELTWNRKELEKQMDTWVSLKTRKRMIPITGNGI